MVFRSSALVLATWLLSAATYLGCSDRVEVGYDSPRATGGSAGSGGAAPTEGGTAGGGAAQCVTAACQGKVYRCGDCMDNDTDGKIDALDPDCLGPCDDTEDSYFPGIPGQSGGGCRQDCQFDRDSGAGNDGCDWTFTCDPMSVAPNYPPSGDASCRYDEQTSIQGKTCSDLANGQAASCLDYCLPLTPNGCDCFGCCELPARSGNTVWIGSTAGGLGTCSQATLSDPNACRPCTQVRSCLNTCATCEVCAGETAIPAACNGAQPSCPSGQPSCGPNASCPAGKFCITGCCVDIPR
ncbi:MAG TPA: hypothetical protein VG937_10205 [Polyangiaceae bacterium]|nr:hypothetical protein [Polyangiaceae bacterium]